MCYIIPYLSNNDPVAQSVEQLTFNQWVSSSNLLGITTFLDGVQMHFASIQDYAESNQLAFSLNVAAGSLFFILTMQHTKNVLQIIYDKQQFRILNRNLELTPDFQGLTSSFLLREALSLSCTSLSLIGQIMGIWQQVLPIVIFECIEQYAYFCDYSAKKDRYFKELPTRVIEHII